MADYITVGTKEVKTNPKENISLYQVVQEDEPGLFYKSVFISRDGSVSIEEYDGNYAAAGGDDEDIFPTLRQKIIDQIVEVFPLLEEAGYFDEGVFRNRTMDHIPFEVYSSPYPEHLYDAIYVDKDFNFQDTMMHF